MTVELKVDEHFVSYVLDTYDLPDKTRERLKRTSLFRFRENWITDFDEAYNYIDNLAMGAELRSRARIRSLDEEVGETERTLHEIIGNKSSDEGLRKLFGDLQNRKKLSGREIIQGLSFCLDRQDIEVLSVLMGECKIEFDVSLDYLLDHAEEIGERIRQTAQRYEKDGVILLPKRPIVSVSFNYFSVEFEEHRGRPLTDGEITSLVTAHESFGGNATSVARHLGYSKTTVLHYWRNLGFKVKNHGAHNKVTDEELRAIISAHSEFNGNANRAARELNRNPSTILKYWKGEDLVIRPKGYNRY